MSRIFTTNLHDDDALIYETCNLEMSKTNLNLTERFEMRGICDSTLTLETSNYRSCVFKKMGVSQLKYKTVVLKCIGMKGKRTESVPVDRSTSIHLVHRVKKYRLRSSTDEL